MDKEKISYVLQGVFGKTSEEIINILRYNCPVPLCSQEQSIIYSLAISQPVILHDGDLSSFIKTHRNAFNIPRGSLQEDLDEVSMLIKAWRSPQYKRYIKHMMISFLDNSLVFPIEGYGEDECGICKKKLFRFNSWDEMCKQNPGFGEQNRKEYLSFGSKNSKNSICMDCLVQLGIAYDLLEHLYPGFLTKSF